MPWIQALLLAAIFAVPTTLLLALIWWKSGEQCPEREPDGCRCGGSGWVNIQVGTCKASVPCQQCRKLVIADKWEA